MTENMRRRGGANTLLITATRDSSIGGKRLDQIARERHTMPIEAAIQISSIFPGCRVVLLSGQAETADLLRDARVRGHEFEILLKPVHPSMLLDRLRVAS